MNPDLTQFKLIPGKIWRVTPRGVCSIAIDGTAKQRDKIARYIAPEDLFPTQGDAIAAYRKRNMNVQ